MDTSKKRGPKGPTKWTFSRVAESSRDFTSFSVWRKSCPGAYSAACRNGWISHPEVVGHLIKADPIKWTRQRIIESASQYKNRHQWNRGEVGAYNACQKRGWMDDPEITGHMPTPTPQTVWTEEKIAKSAARFQSRTKWREADQAAYSACVRRGWLFKESITGHMPLHEVAPQPSTADKWPISRLAESAAPYNTLKEWHLGDPAACNACKTLKLTRDARITGHMKWRRSEAVRRGRQAIIESAAKYKTKREWELGDGGAYRYCWKHFDLNDPEITGHMVAGHGSTDNDCVYLYRLSIEGVDLYKIGLTSYARGTDRIRITTRQAGTVARDVMMFQVKDARSTEAKMLRVGDPQDLYRGDGHTEMRHLSPSGVERVISIAASDAVSREYYPEV